MFKSPRAHHPHGSGGVAQLGEHLLCTQGVVGSNPVASMIADVVGQFFHSSYEVVVVRVVPRSRLCGPRGCAPKTLERSGDSSYEGHVVDALAVRGDEGRRSLRKASGSGQARDDPKISEWGNPAGFMPSHPQGSQPGELKHLSTRRKGNQRDSVSSGERTRTSPNRLACRSGL